MIGLLSVYECTQCGKVLSDQVDTVEIIDRANDDVFTIKVCQACGREVQPAGELEQVSEERRRWADGYYNDFFDEALC